MNKPTIRILRSGDEAILEDFLLPRVESSMFLIGSMRASGLTDSGPTRAGTYAAAFKDGKIVGVVAHNWSQHLIFQAPVHLDLLWRVALEGSQRPIGGLMGPNEQVVVVKGSLKIDDSRIQLPVFL